MEAENGPGRFRLVLPLKLSPILLCLTADCRELKARSRQTNPRQSPTSIIRPHPCLSPSICDFPPSVHSAAKRFNGCPRCRTNEQTACRGLRAVADQVAEKSAPNPCGDAFVKAVAGRLECVSAKRNHDA